MFRRTTFSAALLCVSQLASTQIVSRAYVGDDGKAHLVFKNGKQKIVAAEPGQVGCDSISVADNEHTVAWSVLVDNCCTSYPIATSIVVYMDGKKIVILPGRMVWRWQFLGQGDQIAVLYGPVHGFPPAANLYDTHTGKLLASWDGKGSVPEWAEQWRHEFESDENP